ncbi:MAG TPA: hypothetical protein DDW49_06910 [Deltaproteobacteria bacterium]|nr:hypothetical protein [Deltaproteobacteria bacterium]
MPWEKHNGAFSRPGESIGIPGQKQFAGVLRFFIAPALKDSTAFLARISEVDDALKKMSEVIEDDDAEPEEWDAAQNEWYQAGMAAMAILEDEIPSNPELRYRVALAVSQFEALVPRSEWRIEGPVDEAHVQAFMDHFGDATRLAYFEHVLGLPK